MLYLQAGIVCKDAINRVPTKSRELTFKTLEKATRASSNQNSTKLNLNNISTWIHNNGGSDNNLLEHAGCER